MGDRAPSVPADGWFETADEKFRGVGSTAVVKPSWIETEGVEVSASVLEMSMSLDG
jgi:hypothetical protein